MRPARRALLLSFVLKLTRPAARITRDLREEGLLDVDVEPVLAPVYEGGVTAVRFEIPQDVVEILRDPPER